MTLQLYKNSGGQGAISFDGTFSNAILIDAGLQGSTTELRYFLRSDNPMGESFPSVTLFSRDATTPDESGWITFAPDVNGSAGTYGPTLTVSIGLGQEVPIWIRANIPAGVAMGNKTDISIVGSYITSSV
jgi:hypothetical protein